MSTRTQPAQLGLRAKQTRRPCRISRNEKRPRSSGGTSALRSSSAFTGSVSFVSFSRRDSRPTCVSTGRPGRSNATDRTTLPVLRPTPGSFTRSSSSVGTSPSKSSSSMRAIPSRFFVFERKKPVECTIASTSSGSACARSRGVGYFGEQLRRDLVDVLVGGLRGQDRGREQLERVVVHERALGIRVFLRETVDHDRRARLRSSWSGHERDATVVVSSSPRA